MLLFFLRCFRMGVYPEKASADFGMGTTEGSYLFKTAARALAEMLRREFPPPTQAEVFATTPQDFIDKSGMDNVELILDATGVKFGRPQNPEIARWFCLSHWHFLFVTSLVAVWLSADLAMLWPRERILSHVCCSVSDRHHAEWVWCVCQQGHEPEAERRAASFDEWRC